MLLPAGQTWRTLDPSPVPSATCLCESVLPIRLGPDFSVVFVGYAGAAVNRLRCQVARKRSLRADILRTSRLRSFGSDHCAPVFVTFLAPHESFFVIVMCTRKVLAYLDGEA